jgi:hypothetical protein
MPADTMNKTNVVQSFFFFFFRVCLHDNLEGLDITLVDAKPDKNNWVSRPPVIHAPLPPVFVA